MGDDNGNAAIDWALAEASRLKALATQDTVSQAELAPATEFLRHHAGRTSAFVQQLENAQGWQTKASLKHAAAVLRSWVNYVGSGVGTALQPEAQARVQASTDLMEQVRELLEDRKVHAVAPVMLAAAALEEFLRSLVLAHGLTVTGKPSISAFAQVLHKAKVIDDIDLKDVAAWSGTRNAAAHGDFAKISMERALLLADGINLFIRKHEAGRAAT